MTLTIPRAPAVLPATVRVPCRPALDSEGLSAARRAAQKAAAAGWAVMLTYAAGVETRGTYVAETDRESGRSKRLVRAPVDVESVALRAARSDARRFLVWERVPGGRWSCVSGYGYSRTQAIHKLYFSVRGACSWCGRWYAVRADGTTARHAESIDATLGTCPGSEQPPVRTEGLEW